MPIPIPIPMVAPIPTTFRHEANLLSRNAKPALLFPASAVLTTPTFPVRVPIPILPAIGGGAVVSAVAGPCAIGTSPWAPTRPPAAGAAAAGAAAAGLERKRSMIGLSECGKERLTLRPGPLPGRLLHQRVAEVLLQLCKRCISRRGQKYKVSPVADRRGPILWILVDYGRRKSATYAAAGAPAAATACLLSRSRCLSSR